MSAQVTRDLIVSVKGPGWNYGLARLLVDANNRASLWLPPGEAPVREFTIDPGRTNPMSGVGVTDEGEMVAFRRKGAGCGWALAQCKVSTQVLASRWLRPEPEAVEPAVEAQEQDA